MEYHWIAEGVFTLTSFFSKAECESYIKRSESLQFSEAPISTAFGEIRMTDIRNNTRVILDSAEKADQIWKQAQEYIPDTIRNWHVVGLNERLRFYRYKPGESFKWHRDGAYRRPNGEISFLTFMIYLNDNFKGGTTDFGEFQIEPKQGMVLCFVHSLMHEGSQVLEGTKYVLRTDVMYASSVR